MSKIDLFDLGAIFQEPCDPEKVRRQDSKEKEGIDEAEVI